jgi:hypothetical protein
LIAFRLRRLPALEREIWRVIDFGRRLCVAVQRWRRKSAIRKDRED